VVITVTTRAPPASAATTAVVRTTEVGGAEAVDLTPEVDRTEERAGAEPMVGLDDAMPAPRHIFLDTNVFDSTLTIFRPLHS